MAITDILTDAQLDKLRTSYDAHPDEMRAVLSGIALSYPPVKAWLDSVGNSVFTELSLTPEPNLPLSAVDRERCLIALIADRRETLNLAVHIYMGLMVGLSPAEVANVLALTGIYTGISAYIRGIRVAETTLTVLKTIAALPDPGPKAAIGALGLTFATTWGG